MTCPADFRAGLSVEVSVKTPNVPFEIAITGTSASKTITITVPETGYWLFRLWIIDSAATPNAPSLSPPTTPGESTFFEVTNASGVLAKTFTYSGTKDWYVCATLLGQVSVSDVLAFS